jgi:hypothetical protein
VSLRARLAIVITTAAALLGLGAAAQAAPVAPNLSNTANNGCVVVPSAQLAVCLERF